MPHLEPTALYDFYKTTPMRNGVLNWYPFGEDSSALEQSGEALSGMLQNKCGRVISFEGEYTGSEKFDYVVVVDSGAITVELLSKYYSYLNERGRLLLAFENPYGLQYFSGKRNPRTDAEYTFWVGESKKEIEIQLEQAGFAAQKWYYPFTDHYFTREIYSESCLPNEFLNHRGHEYITDDYTKQFDERGLWKEVIRGGAFPFLCNSYLVEACVSSSDKSCEVDYAAITAYREREKAFITTVRNNQTAEKIAIYPEGKEQLAQTFENHKALCSLGVNALAVELIDGKLTMARIELPTLWDWMTRKLSEHTLDEKILFYLFDKINDEITKTANSGKCFWEMVPANCFYDETNGELIFFDQEYTWVGVDYRMALVRAIHALLYSFAFKNCDKTEEWVASLKQRYDLEKDWDQLAEMADKQTIEFVFNEEATKPVERFTDRAWLRMKEQEVRAAELAAERVAERAAKRARYNKMCVVAVTLRSRQITHPAIYGYGARGQMLRLALELNDIDVTCVIDKSMPIACGIPLVASVEEMSEPPDVIIVTPLKGANEIADEIKSIINCPVMTIEEVVNG